MIEHFIQSFGDITVGQAVIVISAIVFLAMVYKKVTSYISKKALDEKEKNDRIQEVIDQAKQYPVWRQQSVDIQEKFNGKKYDMAFANIVADIVIPLSAMVPDFIRDKGIFICSGIISERLNDVTEALNKNGFEILEITRKKDWCAIASRLK